ncbi:hypothetical protein CK203_048243 [Vitis vinifera]|uniref:Uncharacterized protein n=1 Tax=Vitis vinifera TaxID=29760 RepID=A0A438H097_VITVI|nr:hypothetical protein CK203_048243 [Vitis vinifera]
MHPRVNEEVEIREMENGLDPQRDFEHTGPELDISPPPQSEGIHVEATFSEPMMTESSYTTGPSSQPSFTELPHTEISSQARHAPDHCALDGCISSISSLETRMEELALRFEHIEERMDQQQATVEHFQQSIERIESRQASQHEEMMAYLCSVFPPPPPQP